MRMIEITKENSNDQTIRFRLFEGLIELLENYQNPSQELEISFDLRFNEYDVLYMEAIVREKITNDRVILINYTLGRNHIGNINNIIPIKTDDEKVSHTPEFSEKGFAASVGIKSLRWIKDQIIQDAKSRGYDIKEIVSKNRHTGARAKSAQDTGKDLDPNVKLKLKECYIVYSDNYIKVTEYYDNF